MKATETKLRRNQKTLTADSIVAPKSAPAITSCHHLYLNALIDNLTKTISTLTICYGLSLPGKDSLHHELSITRPSLPSPKPVRVEALEVRHPQTLPGRRYHCSPANSPGILA